MPTVKVSPTLDSNSLSHDVSLAHDGSIIGLRYVRGEPAALQHIPITEPVRQFSEAQQDWTGGRGRKFFRDDPSAYWDSRNAWTMTGGEVYNAPQWYYGSGVRTALVSTTRDSYTGSVSWRGLYGSERYMADAFLVTSATTQSATHVQVKIRQVGYPGNLTLKIYSATASPGEPNAIVATATALSPTVGDFEAKDYEFQMDAYTLTNAVWYWVVVLGAANDNESDHWELGVDTSSSGVLSSAGSTWATASPACEMYYRITPADIEQKMIFFVFDHALYALTTLDNGGAPTLYINGDRGRATGTQVANTATEGYLVDTGGGVGGWTANQWVGYKVRLLNSGSQVRTITSNTTNTLTVTPKWRRVPVAGSTTYIIYDGPSWQAIAGNGSAGHNLTVAPTCRPTQANGVCYFCQGAGVNIQRMQIDYTKSTNHDFQDILVMTTYRYDFMETHMMPNLGVRLFAAKSAACTAGYTTPPAWSVATPVAFSGIKGGTIGASDFRITSMKSCGEKIYFGKEDSLWYLDESTPKQFTLAIKDVPDFDNLSSIAAQGDTVYFGYGNSFGYLQGTEHRDLLNYRAGYEGLPADRTGTVTAVLAVLGWVFFAVDGGDSNYSTVYAWNGIGLHEVWRSWKVGCRIRDLYYFACYESSGQLWIDANGEPVYITLPLNKSNPRLDSNMNYRPEWSITTGTIDIEKENLYKAIKRIRVMSENLSTNTRWIEIDYQTDANVGTATWTKLGKIVTSPYQEIKMALGTIKKIRFRFRGLSIEDSTPTVMTSFDILGEIAEPPIYQWIGTFDVSEEGETYDGQMDFKPTDVYNWLKEAHEKMIVCHMRAARGIDDDKKVTLSLPADVTSVIEKGKWDGRISVQIREV